MSELKGAMIIGQSGGPSSVINASCYGAIKAGLDSDCITKVYGAANGIVGVLEDRLYVMDEEDPEELAIMKYTPSSALGSCRYKIADPDVDDTDYKRILEIFKKYDVRYFFYNGGNDSMDTCNKVSKYLLKCGYACNVIGVPKTIDNDLYGTDHCPGYGSAAKYVATTLMELNLDAKVYDKGQVAVIEIMGRNAGWLTAAAALANYKNLGADLIYLPEVPFSVDKFLSDVKRVMDANNGKCIACVSEGIRDKDGNFIVETLSSAKEKDGFGHTQLGGLAIQLGDLVNRTYGVKVRGIEFSLMQRCGAHLASGTDIEEAFNAGRKAVKAACAGQTDKMVAFERDMSSGKYKCKYKLIPVSMAANTEKKVPLEWITPDGTGLTSDYIEYALPLIQGASKSPLEDGLPKFANLKKVQVEKR